jgi:hypothetical protein
MDSGIYCTDGRIFGKKPEDRDRILSSLADGHYFLSEPVYNVVIEDANTIKWSLDSKVKLAVLPNAPP